MPTTTTAREGPPAGPANLDELRKISGVHSRVLAADRYIAAREQAIEQAREIRNAAIREIVDTYGVTETARLTGYHVSTIKAIRGPAPKKGSTR